MTKDYCEFCAKRFYACNLFETDDGAFACNDCLLNLEYEGLLTDGDETYNVDLDPEEISELTKIAKRHLY